jgi:hypothetical protein
VGLSTTPSSNDPTDDVYYYNLKTARGYLLLPQAPCRDSNRRGGIIHASLPETHDISRIRTKHSCETMLQ